MAEQLFKVCPECNGRLRWDRSGDVITPVDPCAACSGEGYVPVDAPEPLTGEERKRMLDGLPASCDDEWGPVDYFDSFIAALPARFGVRMEGSTDETR